MVRRRSICYNHQTCLSDLSNTLHTSSACIHRANCAFLHPQLRVVFTAPALALMPIHPTTPGGPGCGHSFEARVKPHVAWSC